MPNSSQNEYHNLVEAYSDNRYYHNMTHIAACLNYLKIYKSYNPLSSDEEKSLTMAIFYHDYEQGVDAENLSKAKAKQFLSLGNDAKNTTSVLSLIDATKHLEDETPLNHLQQIMSDLDLNILGAQKNRYNNYKQLVRQDYSHVDENTYAAGRIQVLNKLLSKDNLYKTEFFKNMFLERAIENLNNEKSGWEARTIQKTKPMNTINPSKNSGR